MSIQPSSVLCAQEFTVSFQFEDPQGDIAGARVSLQRNGSTTLREQMFLWPDTMSKSRGVVFFPLSFTPKPCTGLGGAWSVTVQAEDDQGNTSNTLTGGQVSLTAPG